MAISNFAVVPSTSDYNALTQWVVDAAIYDNVFIGRPTLDKLKQNMKTYTGQGIQGEVEYAGTSGEWFTSATTFTLAAQAQSVTRFQYQPYALAKHLTLPTLEIYGQGNKALANLMTEKTKNALKGLSAGLSADIMAATTTSNAFCSIPVIIGDTRYERSTNPVGGLDNSSLTWWKSFIAEGESDGVTDFGKCVSPTIENLAKVGRYVSTSIGEPLNNATWVVHPDLWDVLYGQLTANQYAMAMQAVGGKNQDVFRWGYPAFAINGVPVTQDFHMIGAAWVASQATRALAIGYEAMLINWNHLNLYYNAELSWKWRKEGWLPILDKPLYTNMFFVVGNIGTNMRRAHARVYNIDIAEAPASYSPCTVDVPPGV